MSSLRQKANNAKKNRCTSLICVLENPKNIINIATVSRNIDTLGIGKLYVVDEKNILPDTWNEMKDDVKLKSISCGAIKYSYIHKFKSSKECIDYLESKKFTSIVTSPHLLGQKNVLLNEGKFTQRKLAVWFGNETHGISKEAVNNSVECVQIEMSGISESINLAISTGIVLYTIAQQRRKYKTIIV